jgi:hypothetical protein
MQTGKHQGIPAVIFDLLPLGLGILDGATTSQSNPWAGEVTVDLISTGTGFIHKVQPVAFADQFSNHLVEGRKGAVDFPVVPHLPFTAFQQWRYQWNFYGRPYQ